MIIRENFVTTIWAVDIDIQWEPCFGSRDIGIPEKQLDTGKTAFLWVAEHGEGWNRSTTTF